MEVYDFSNEALFQICTGTSLGLMVINHVLRNIFSEFDSYWVLHTSDLVSNYSWLMLKTGILLLLSLFIFRGAAFILISVSATITALKLIKFVFVGFFLNSLEKCFIEFRFHIFCQVLFYVIVLNQGYF